MNACHRASPPDRARQLFAGALFMLFAVSTGHALASEPKDRVICTDAPQSTWMSEAEARKRFNADQYMLVKFKLSSERCHEFYAVEHDGSAIEAYVHPVTGEVVRMTRIPAPAASPATGATAKTPTPTPTPAPAPASR